MFEELIHKAFVVFGSCFNQLGVEFLSFFEFFGRDFADGGHASIRTPFVFLHQQHVDEGIEAWTCIDWILHRSDARTECFAQLGDGVFVVGFFAVELVNGKHHRLVYVFGGAEYVLGAHFNAILSINENNAAVGDVERSDSVAHEVVATRAVNYVKLFIEELSIDNC